MLQDQCEEHRYPLRFWLVERANLNDFEAVTWQSKEEQTIKILWADFQSPGWEDCSKLFQAWVSPGSNNGVTPTYSKVKQTFGDAMRQSNYYEELRDKRTKKQSGNYRIYRLLTPKETQEKKQKKKKSSRGNSTQDTPESSQSMDLTTDSQTDFSMDNIDELFNSNNVASAMEPIYDSPACDMNDFSSHQHPDTSDPHGINLGSLEVSEAQQQQQPSLEDFLKENGVDCSKLSKFHFNLVYDNVRVEQKEIDFAHGYRFVSNDMVRITNRDDWNTVSLPEYNGCNSDVELALRCLTDGLALKSDGFCLYGTRKAKVFVNYSNCDCEGESFKKMNRNQETVLFSYSNYILQVYNYRFGIRKKRPICGVILSLGKDPSSHNSSLPVGMIIEPVVAETLTCNIDSPNAMSDGILFSNDNSLDEIYHHFAEQLKL